MTWSKSNKQRPPIFLLFLFVIVFWLYFAFPMWRWSFDPLESSLEREHFSAFFEALHTLVDALAFLCLLYTVWQQNDEIIDLKKADHLQNFQSNFFNFLSLFNQYVSSLSEGNREGRECTTEWKRMLVAELKALRRRCLKTENSKPKWLRDRDRGESFFLMSKSRKNHVLPYFQHLYNLISILAEEADTENKRDRKIGNAQLEHYFNMIRSQISPDEAALWKCYCYSKYGSAMKERIVKLDNWVAERNKSRPKKDQLRPLFSVSGMGA